MFLRKRRAQSVGDHEATEACSEDENGLSHIISSRRHDLLWLEDPALSLIERTAVKALREIHLCPVPLGPQQLGRFSGLTLFLIRHYIIQ